MMAVGVVLAGTSIKSIFTSGRAYWISFGRLILYPLIAMTVLYFSGLLRHHPELVPILLVSFMSLSAPTASNVAQMAVIYDQRTTEASIYNILSMFFCVITIPLVIWMYQLLFM
jgi:predicted permease